MGRQISSKGILFLLIGFLPFAFAHTAISQMDHGKNWCEASPDQRLGWVWGFAEGTDRMLDHLAIKDKEKLEPYIAPDQAKRVSEIMTELYRKPANNVIPWGQMTCIAKRKLAGMSDLKIEERLVVLRKYAAWLQKKKR